LGWDRDGRRERGERKEVEEEGRILMRRSLEGKNGETRKPKMSSRKGRRSVEREGMRKRAHSEAQAILKPVLSKTPHRMGTPAALEARPENLISPVGWFGGGRVKRRRVDSWEEVRRWVA